MPEETQNTNPTMGENAEETVVTPPTEPMTNDGNQGAAPAQEAQTEGENAAPQQ